MTANPTTGITGIYTKRDPEFLQPGSAQWSKVITPSKVAAILGVSRYESAYRLWHRMQGLVDPEPPKEVFDIGHDLEAYAANRWRRRNLGWRLSEGEVQVHIDPTSSGFRAWPPSTGAACGADRVGWSSSSRRGTSTIWNCSAMT
ncbi:hypothetical protein ACRYGV_18125 [Mycobacteroides abscessus]